jgi:hypothetical protein
MLCADIPKVIQNLALRLRRLSPKIIVFTHAYIPKVIQKKNRIRFAGGSGVSRGDDYSSPPSLEPAVPN